MSQSCCQCLTCCLNLLDNARCHLAAVWDVILHFMFCLLVRFHVLCGHSHASCANCVHKQIQATALLAHDLGCCSTLYSLYTQFVNSLISNHFCLVALYTAYCIAMLALDGTVEIITTSLLPMYLYWAQGACKVLRSDYSTDILILGPKGHYSKAKCLKFYLS